MHILTSEIYNTISTQFNLNVEQFEFPKKSKITIPENYEHPIKLENPNIFEWCTYITVYAGTTFPPKIGLEQPFLYIGSSKSEFVLNKMYHGSVCSQQYMKLWKDEIKNNPQLFKTYIVSFFETQQQARYHELLLQKVNNVIKNPLYLNMSYANGSFAGCMFGTKFKPHSEESKKHLSEINSGGKNRNAKQFKIIDPLGNETIVIGGLDKFCKDNNLSRSTMRKFINQGIIQSGEMQSYFSKKTGQNCIGWQIIDINNPQAIYTNGKPPILKGTRSGVKYSYTFIDPKGNTYVWNDSFSKFCNMHDISIKTLRKFLNIGIVEIPLPHSKRRKFKNTIGWQVSIDVSNLKDIKGRLKL